MGSFVAENGLRPQSLVEEVHLVGPRATDRPGRWRTLVACLILPGDDRPAAGTTDRPTARAPPK